MAHRNKPHKGLLKRVRVTKNGKLKYQRPGGRHLRSNKTGEQIRGLRKPGYFSDVDVKRLSPLLAGHYNPARKPTAAATGAATPGAASESETAPASKRRAKAPAKTRAKTTKKTGAKKSE